MTVTVLKTFFKKSKPTSIKYREKIGVILFKYELAQSMRKNDVGNMNYDKFREIFMTILNKHAPLKEKKIRGNTAPFMNKTLSKAFMERSKRKNRYNKYHIVENKSHQNVLT